MLDTHVDKKAHALHAGRQHITVIQHIEPPGIYQELTFSN
jgi:hypothetical protein